MLFSQSEVNLAALRTVKLSPALIYLAIPQDLHDLQSRRVGFRVLKNTRRAPPFRLGNAQVCVTHRIVKDHPHDPDILSLRHKGLAVHSSLGKTRDLRYL